MEQLSQIVNHANGLAGGFDKEYAVRTLQALVRAGHRFDVDNLVAWALAHSFTGSEAERLRDYATKALQGHHFRLGGRAVLRDDIVGQWEQATEQK